jgi:hypothetical protein
LKYKAVEKTNTFAKTNAHTAVNTIHLTTRRTLAKKFHRAAGAGAGNAAIAAACLPVSIVPGSICEIRPILPPKRSGLAMKNHISRLCLNAVQNSDRQTAPSFAKQNTWFCAAWER